MSSESQASSVPSNPYLRPVGGVPKSVNPYLPSTSGGPSSGRSSGKAAVSASPNVGRKSSSPPSTAPVAQSAPPAYGHHYGSGAAFQSFPAPSYQQQAFPPQSFQPQPYQHFPPQPQSFPSQAYQPQAYQPAYQQPMSYQTPGMPYQTQPPQQHHHHHQQQRQSFQPTSQWTINYNEIELGKELGRGAFGVVYKGRWRMTNVAVKVCQGQPSSADLKTFADETQLMMSLRPHRNVVQLRGVCQNPLSVVIDFVDGGALESRLHDMTKPVTWEDVFQWARGICAGMLHIHLEGIVHRDLAARNVLLDSRNDALIADFGLSAKTFGVSGNQTREMGFFRGPYKWMAPESLQSNDFSIKSDVWSFGVTLWEVLSRHLPFEDKTIYQVKDEVVRIKLRLPMSTKWPETWKNLLVACFRTSPHMRPDMATLGGWLDQMYKDYQGKKDAAYNTLPVMSDDELPKPMKTASGPTPGAAATHQQQGHHQHGQHHKHHHHKQSTSAQPPPSKQSTSHPASAPTLVNSTSAGSYQPPKPTTTTTAAAAASPKPAVVVEDRLPASVTHPQSVSVPPAATPSEAVVAAKTPSTSQSTSAPAEKEAPGTPQSTSAPPQDDGTSQESTEVKSAEERALERKLGLTNSTKTSLLKNLRGAEMTVQGMKKASISEDSSTEDKK